MKKDFMSAKARRAEHERGLKRNGIKRKAGRPRGKTFTKLVLFSIDEPALIKYRQAAFNVPCSLAQYIRTALRFYYKNNKKVVK